MPIQVPVGKIREDFILDDDSDDFNNSAQSDLVRLALNFPYLSKECQDDFGFDLHNVFHNEAI